MRCVLDAVDPCIFSNMVAVLQESFIEEEVLSTLHEIHLTKALGPNGIPALFFKNFWHVIDNDVLHTILVVFNDNLEPSYLNKTHIVLIPKISNPKNTKDFRPISLHNMIFKIITKTITNKLKLILPNIIHQT